MKKLTVENKQRMIAEVKQFEAELCEKYACNIELNISLANAYLDKLINICNATLKAEHSREYHLTKSEGIRSKLRNRPIVLLRYIYFSLATEAGYSLTKTGAQVHADHASVHHGKETFKNLFYTKDALTEKLYRLVSLALNE